MDLKNPETFINAALAAKLALEAANQSYLVAMIVLGSVVLIAVATVFMAVNFKALVRNTDGMREELMIATRKLALIEGNIIGRAEQTKEQEDKEKG